MKYNYTIPSTTATSIISDAIKLAVMASIQPIVVGLLSRLFLRVPDGPYYDREEFIEGAGYRIKEMIITIVTAPVIALLAARLTTYLSDYLSARFGSIIASLLGVATVAIMSVISVIPLLLAGVAFGTAILWRIVITLVGKMIITFVTNALCLTIFNSVINGMDSQIIAEVFILIAWLVITDIGLIFLKRAIVSR